MIEDKDLLELAKLEPSAAEKVIATMDFDVAKFIEDIGIVEDNRGFVELELIHWAYVKWAQFNNKPILDRRPFGLEFKKQFKRLRIGWKSVYYVNKEPFQINEKEKWIMRAFKREKNDNDKKKADKRQASRAKKTVQQQS